MDNSEQAKAVGEKMAVCIALNALIALHPNRQQVLDVLAQQRLVGESFFLSEPLPDVALDAFCATLDFVTGASQQP